MSCFKVDLYMSLDFIAKISRQWRWHRREKKNLMIENCEQDDDDDDKNFKFLNIDKIKCIRFKELNALYKVSYDYSIECAIELIEMWYFCLLIHNFDDARIKITTKRAFVTKLSKTRYNYKEEITSLHDKLAQNFNHTKEFAIVHCNDNKFSLFIHSFQVLYKLLALHISSLLNVHISLHFALLETFTNLDDSIAIL